MCACLVCCQQEFELAVHHGDANGQLAALRKCTTSHSVASDTLLEMCDMCKGAADLLVQSAGQQTVTHATQTTTCKSNLQMLVLSCIFTASEA
jgi:hypothetical protein